MYLGSYIFTFLYLEFWRDIRTKCHKSFDSGS